MWEREREREGDCTWRICRTLNFGERERIESSKHEALDLLRFSDGDEWLTTKLKLFSYFRFHFFIYTILPIFFCFCFLFPLQLQDKQIPNLSFFFFFLHFSYFLYYYYYYYYSLFLFIYLFIYFRDKRCVLHCWWYPTERVRYSNHYLSGWVHVHILSLF